MTALNYSYMYKFSGLSKSYETKGYMWFCSKQHTSLLLNGVTSHKCSRDPERLFPGTRQYFRGPWNLVKTVSSVAD